MAGLKCTTCFLSLLFVFAASQGDGSSTLAETTPTEAPATTSKSRFASSITSSTPGLTVTAPAPSTASTSSPSSTIVANKMSATSEPPAESSSTGSVTISPNSSSSLEKTSDLPPISFSTVTSFSNESDLTSAYASTNSSIGGLNGPDLARNPGLVAVICIFAIVLVLLLAVAIAKSMKSRGPQFEKLDDVQMNKMTEESPFARFPPK
ncbi:protein CIST1-like [Conger conger]|uniref:protein CIST1-like n=1 Tax=Conger conger TaxID=82655 RepID=UPI002A59EF05|nr:protein CIST1-like [Conger conger]